MVPLTRKGVIERDGMCSIRAGGDGSSAQWWVDRSKALPVARAARRFAAAKADPSEATAAVQRSAGATLTPGHIAIERAGDAAARLNGYLDAKKRSGVLKEFNAAFNVICSLGQWP
jgi:hypothetical protein